MRKCSEWHIRLVMPCALTVALPMAPALAQTYGQPYSNSQYRPLDGTPRRETYREPTRDRTLAYEQPGIWQGLYMGGHGGYSIASVMPDKYPAFETYGGSFGLHAGYNWQMGSIVLGVEGDTSWQDTQGWRDLRGFAIFNGRTDFASSLRLRAGYAFDNVLFYATAGASLSRLNVALDTGLSTYRESELLNGYVLGGGLEVKLSHSMSGRIEALHYGFNDKTFHFNTGWLPVKSSTTTIRAGLTFHFN